MNILIITPFLPYPITSGGAQAQYNIIDYLKDGNKIFIVFPENRGNTMASVEKLKQLWPQVVFFPYPFKKQLLNFKFMALKARKGLNRIFNPFKSNRTIRIALEDYKYPVNRDFKKFLSIVIKQTQPDIIQSEFYLHIGMAKELPENIKKVFVHHEIRFIINDRMTKTCNLTASQVMLRNKRKEDEITLLNMYNSIITLTKTDKDVLIEAGVRKPIFVSPAAVNTNPLPFIEWTKKLIYVGGYDFYPNHEAIDWFFNDVIPLIPGKYLDGVELLLIGRGWPISYEKRSVKMKCRCMGFVDDLAAIAHGGIMIVPLQTGSGMRMKLLDASAISMPIVTTSIGCEGLSFKNNDNCMIADNAQTFANSLLSLIEDEELRMRLGTQANKLYMKEYSAAALSTIRESVYKKIVGAPI